MTTSTIVCGNCKAIHTSVEDVRACYATRVSQPFVGSAAQANYEEELLPCEAKAIATGKVPSALCAPATQKQLDFIAKLRAERELAPQEVYSKRDASDMIGLLLAMKPAANRANVEEALEAQPVPEGYYAIDMNDTVKFYRVDAPMKGKWAGRTFLSVQASDDFHPIRAAATRSAVFAAIAAQGVQEGMARYGKLIGRCGVCNRTLTDETSRALGIGPVCRGRGA